MKRKRGQDVENTLLSFADRWGESAARWGDLDSTHTRTQTPLTHPGTPKVPPLCLNSCRHRHSVQICVRWRAGTQRPPPSYGRNPSASKSNEGNGGVERTRAKQMVTKQAERAKLQRQRSVSLWCVGTILHTDWLLTPTRQPGRLFSRLLL